MTTIPNEPTELWVPGWAEEPLSDDCPIPECTMPSDGGVCEAHGLAVTPAP